MAVDPNEYLAGALAVFDSLNLEDKYARRTAVKPLYDYYQVLVLEAAVRLCGFNKTAMEREHLATRWIKIKTALELVDNPKIWDEHIGHVSNVRDGVEHNDGRFPPAESLKDIRKKAPEFTNWLLMTGEKYREISNNFSLLQEFFLKARWYSGEAEGNIAKYGENAPYSIEAREAEEYKMLKQLSEKTYARIHEITGIDKITKEDLNDLVELVKQTERLDARETILLRFGICPKCGDKIADTQKEIVGEPEEPPNAIYYRTGCEKCDYTLNEETIDI